MSSPRFAKDVTVGVVVLLGAFIFTLGIFTIGSEKGAWVRKVAYSISVPDANGLQPGSPVRLAGVQVGAVTSVAFPEDANVSGIVVGLAVDQAHQERIRKDTKAEVRILTLLAGEKYVELTPGTPAEPVLAPGSFIQVPDAFGIEQLGELSGKMADDLVSISGNVREILVAIAKKEGIVGKMFLDPNFGNEALADIAESARLTRATLEDIHQGDGLVARAISDGEFARSTMTSIRDSLARVESLLDKATLAGGPIDRALDPNGSLGTALDNLQQASADVRDFTAQLKEGKGVVGRLVSDDPYAEELLVNIRRIASDLAAITDKLNRGEGTLGEMINDPQLFEDLKSVVRGVQESRMLSGLVKHYRKKGEKAEVKEGEETGREAPPQIDPNGAVPTPKSKGGS